MIDGLTATQFAQMDAHIKNVISNTLGAYSNPSFNNVQTEKVHTRDVYTNNLQANGHTFMYSCMATVMSCNELMLNGINGNGDMYESNSVKQIIIDLRKQVTRLNEMLCVLIEDEEKLKKHAQLAEIYQQYKVTEALLSNDGKKST